MKAVYSNIPRAFALSILFLFTSATLLAQGLPSGWTDGDVGSVGLAGSASYSSNVFTVKGSGAGMSGTADGMNFLYQPLSGDGTIIARVVSDSAGEAGLMIRETLNANAAEAFVIDQSSFNYFYDRASTGANVSQAGGSLFHALPYWLKLVRSTNTFSAYGSPDGITWSQIGTTQTITMAQSVYVGLVVTSQSNSSLATATFDNVSLNSGASPAPSITGISPVVGLAGGQVTISGSGFGSSQGSGFVLLNGSTLTVNSWSNSSITATIPSGATTGSVVVSVAPTMNDSNPYFFLIGTQPLSPWIDVDLGSGGQAGSASFSNGTFTVKGSGTGVGGTADAMNFMFQPLSGDGTIVARIVSVQGSNAQAGVMIRETLSTNATNAFICDCSFMIYYDRSTTGGSETNLGNNGSGLPYWAKLVRAGNTFTAYASPDGLNWNQVGATQTITMAQNVYVGLAVSSQSNSSLATATFDSVSVNSAASPAPVITSISATTGSAGSYVGIVGSGYGDTQGNSVVTLNGTPVTVNTWNATEIVITIPSGATSGLLLVSVAPSMNDSNPVIFTVTSQPLPAGWLDQDIATSGGSATYSNGQINVNSGSGSIGSTSDQFHFVYQPLSGDGTIVARVANLHGNSSPQAGVMIRETLAGNSKDAFVFFRPSSATLYYRTSTGASASLQSTSFTNPAGAYPYWVKLSRSGSTFTAYVSSDNVYWTQVGTSQTITMAQNVYIGMALSSLGGTASFDNVALSTSTITPPVITALSSTTGMIGSQLVITGSNFGASQGSSTVMLNDTAMPTVAWANSSITVTIPAGAVSGLIAVAIGPGMNSSNAVYFEVTSLPLPTLWMDQDVSSVGVGSATYSSLNGVFTVNGAGASIGSTADSMHFMYQPLTGDGTIIARVVEIQSQSTPKITAMIRETLDPGARDAYVSFQPNQATLGYRSSPGASTSTQSTSFFAGHAYPYWLKLVRSGSSFSGYVSTDGVTWTQAGSTQTISMAQGVYVGLAVTLSSAAVLFDNVSISTPTAPAPAITSISATTGPIGSQVVISGAHFGASQGNSVVWLSDVPMTVNSWTDTSITITISTGAISGYLAVSVAPSMNTSNPVVFTITSQPLPTGWLDSDIGSVGTAGSATYSNGTFTVNAQGSTIDSSTADGFHFAYQSLSGDGAIVARVRDIQGENSGTQAGVMIRQTLDPGSPNVAVWFFPSTASLGYRSSSGGSAAVQSTSFNVGFNPYWVKIARISNNFMAYISADGQNWTQVGTTQTISMPQTVDFGLALCNCSSLNGASFDNVSITSGTMPLVSSVSPTYGTIGTSVTINGSHFGSSQGTSTINFNGVPATSITSWSDGQIIAIVPATASSGAVSVVVNSIESNTDQSFTFYHPVITSLTPSTAGPGARVIVRGTGFGPIRLPGFNINFNNGVQGGVDSPGFGYWDWNDTEIDMFVPPTATSGPVTVSLQGITSNGVQFNVEQLSVTGLSPTMGAPGSLVTITGTGFGSTQTTGTVDFFGTPAAVQSWSDSQIVAVVPTGASSGSVNVAVGGVEAIGPFFTMLEITNITDSKSNQITNTSAMIAGMWVPLTIQGSGCSTCTQRGNISYTYDSAGHALTRTDENGNTTTYTYDGNGDVLTVTVPISSGHTATTSYTYDILGDVLTATDPMGFVTTNTYDGKGNLLSVTTPAPGNGPTASVTKFAYDAKGELTQITDSLGNLTKLAYFPTGMIQTITDAQSNVTTYAYDSQGNRTSVTDANGKQTQFAYDAMNRLTKITYPDTTTTQFAYDVRGRRTSVTDQNSKTTTYAYDDADRLTSVTDAASNVTTYGYDTENNLTSIKDANNNTTSFAYDAFGRVTQTTFPSGYLENYSYDNVGNLTSKTDRKNQLITYTYDQLNRLTKKSYPDTSTVNYTYDDDSRLTQVNDPTGTYQFTFDNMGRLIGTSTQYAFLTSRTFTTSYSYDAAANRIGFTDPESGLTSYVYDALNRLQTLTPPAAISSGNFGFGYDALSRRTSLTRPNNVNTSYSYDNLSRLLSVTHANGGVTLDGASYGLDNAGNRTSKNDLHGNLTTNYGYDNTYELLSATQGANTTESYTYDPVGNRLSNLSGSGWSNNTSNELTSRPGIAYSYDNNGNTQTVVNSSGTTTYAWDFDNRLTNVTLPGTGGTVYFKYDPFGRRIYKSSSSGTSVYAYDGDNLIEETNSSGGAVARYSQGLNIDEPLAELRSGATSYYQADGLGSVTTLSNGSGAVAANYTYDSFGNIVATSGSIVNNFRYTGREWDSETSLYYYRARYYDPAGGRFLTEDPARFRGGINLYDYVRGNPSNWTDPRGLWGAFGFGSVEAATPTPGVRLAGEAVGLVGYNSNDGAYAGTILAGGVEVGGQQNYGAVFGGVESTTLCAKPKKITLKEAAVGVEIPFLIGFGIGVGRYDTADERGYFFFVSGGAIGDHGSVGVGFSTASKP
jgi:RHS repeat-associated protein